MLVVAAAGNNDEDNDIFPNYPSGYNHDIKDFPVVSNITPDNLISVGGSDQYDKKETTAVTAWPPWTSLPPAKMSRAPGTAALKINI